MIKFIKKLLFTLFKFDSPEKAISEIVQEAPSKSSKILDDCHSNLQEAFRLIRLYYRSVKPGYTLVITQSYRSVKDQQKEYKKGRSGIKGEKITTQIDGINKKSKHNYYPSKALDVAVQNGGTGKITWDEEMYKPLIPLCKRVGEELGIVLVSGGSWKTFKDYCHIQLGK